VRGGFRRETLEKLLSRVAGHLPIEAMTIAGYDPSYDAEGKVCATAFAAASEVVGKL